MNIIIIPVSSIVSSSLYYEDDDIYILDKEFTNVSTLTIEIYDEYSKILNTIIPTITKPIRIIIGIKKLNGPNACCIND